MVPGFTATSYGVPSSDFSSTSYPRAMHPRAPGAAPADIWSKPGPGGGHQQPGGHRVTCWSETYCYGVVRMCHTWCDDGTDTRQACGACVGLGGVSLDLW